MMTVPSPESPAACVCDDCISADCRCTSQQSITAQRKLVALEPDRHVSFGSSLRRHVGIQPAG